MNLYEVFTLKCYAGKHGHIVASDEHTAKMLATLAGYDSDNTEIKKVKSDFILVEND